MRTSRSHATSGAEGAGYRRATKAFWSTVGGKLARGKELHLRSSNSVQGLPAARGFSVCMAGVARTRLAEERKAWRKDKPFGFFARPETAPDGCKPPLSWAAVLQCSVALQM